jgi:hypothetical protein
VVARTSLKPSVATGSLDYFANKNSIYLEMSRYSNTSLLDRWFQLPRTSLKPSVATGSIGQLAMSIVIRSTKSAT